MTRNTRMLTEDQSKMMIDHRYEPSQLSVDKQKEFVISLLNQLYENDEVQEESDDIYDMLGKFGFGWYGNDEIEESLMVVHEYTGEEYGFRKKIEFLFLCKENNILFSVKGYYSSYDGLDIEKDITIVEKLQEIKTYKF
jgi:hypothetical protein